MVHIKIGRLGKEAPPKGALIKPDPDYESHVSSDQHG